MRVTRPQGRISLAVWATLERNTGNSALTALIERIIGPVASDALRPPFALGDPDGLEALVGQVLPRPVVTEHQGVARFDLLASWLHTEIHGWTLAGLIDDGDFYTLLRHAEEELGAPRALGHQLVSGRTHASVVAVLHHPSSSDGASLAAASYGDRAPPSSQRALPVAGRANGTAGCRIGCSPSVSQCVRRRRKVEAMTGGQSAIMLSG